MIKVGDVLDGKVTGLTNFGAFVSLPENKTGMVHISEVASSFVSNISDFLKEGQEVRVKVIEINDAGKIGLSIKQVEKSGEGDSAQKAEKKPRNSAPNVWKGAPEKEEGPQTFEDMMLKFKQRSDEKLADLKKATDSRRGSYSKRK